MTSHIKKRRRPKRPGQVLDDQEAISASFIDPDFDELEGTENEIIESYRRRSDED